MKERWLWLISVLSGIDSEIIDEASAERARLLAGVRKRRRTKMISIYAAIAASICIAASTLFFVLGNNPETVPYSISYSATVDGRDLYTITYPDGRTAEFFVENAPAADNSSNVKQVNMNEDGELLVTLKNGSVVNIGKNVGKSESATSTSPLTVSGFTAKSGGVVALGLSNDTELDLGRHYGNKGNAPMDSAYINDAGELVIGFVNGGEINLGRIVGKDGADGVGIDSMSISEEGNLTVILTNGTVLDLGNIKGKDGIGIAKSEINDQGELVITYTDGNSVNLGKVVGKDGADGVGIGSMSISEEGNLTVVLTSGTVLDLGNIKGKDGIGIAKSEINDQGELVITYTDGNSVNLGKVVGKDGVDGVGIGSIKITEEGELNITLTDGTLLELGNIKGEDGKSAYELYCEKYGYEGSEEQWLFDLANGLLAEKIEYTVSFDTGCDATVESQQVIKGEKATEPEPPVYPGYTFLGWFTEDGEKWSFPGYSVTGSVTLYAQWEIISYNVKYENLYVDAELPESYTVTDEISLPDLSKDGLVFLGWTFGEGCFKVTDFEINPEGELVLTFTDGTSAAVGAVRGEDGFYGIESIDVSGEKISLSLSGGTVIELLAIEGNSTVTSCEINESGELVITYSDESTVNLGPVFDENGALLIEVFDITVGADGDFTLILSDQTELTLGRIALKDGNPKKSFRVDAGMTGDLLLVAEWEPIKYTISYELYGADNGNNPTEYNIFTETFYINAPTRLGYNFIGWSMGDDMVRDDRVLIEQGSMGNITLEAHWELETYTINYFNTNYGTPALKNPIEYSVTTPDFVIHPLTLGGYTFLGWRSEGSEELQTEINVPKGSVGNIKIYAVWEACTYSVSYDLGGGEHDGEAPESYKTGDNFTLKAPVRAGYDFVGWKTEDGTEPISEFVLTSGKYGDISLTAVWTPTVYKIAFYGKLIGAANPNPKGYTVVDGDIALLPIERPGYDFIGFTYDGVTEPTFDAVIPGGSMGDVSFTAHFTPITYSITYDLAGGISGGENPVIYTPETESFTLLNPTREHYDFVGWTYIENGEEELSANITVESGSYGDKSFTAVWSPKEYVIGYDLYGGSFTSEPPRQYTVESEKITLPVPQRDGYKFLGWSAFGGEPEIMFVIDAGSYGDISVAAHWEIINYTVTLVTNGGMLIGEYSTGFTVADLPKALPTLEKTDKYFDWYTDAQCNNKISNITSCSDITVYAGFSDGTVSGMEFTSRADGSYAISRYTGAEKNVRIPYTYNGKPVTEISAYAFSGCKTRMSVNIPPSISKIGKGAFENCDLSALTFSGISSNHAESLSIHDRAFYSSGLKSVTVAANTVYIGNSAFGKCNLNRLTFENGSKITGIGKLDGALNMNIGSFAKYEGGYYIGSAENPYLVHIGANADLTEVKLHPSTAVVMGFSGNTEIKNVSLPAGVRGVGADAFSGCTSLASFIAQSVVAVCDSAFENCAALSTVTFKEELIYVGSNAFNGCGKVIAMTVPTTLSIYGINSMPRTLLNIKRGTKVYKLSDLGDLTKENVWIWCGVHVNGTGNSESDAIIPIYCDSADFSYVYDGEEMHFAGAAVFEGGVFTVPDEHYGVPVTSIHGLARNDNAKITQIELPKGLKHWGGSPFKGCKLEGALVVPDTVTHINNYAFSGLEVDEIILPQRFTNIDQIYSQSLIKHITLKGNITRVETFAFSGCNNLEYVILGKQLQYIGGMPFWRGDFTVDLFYEGTKDEFDMDVGLAGSDSLAGTKLYCYSEEKPSESGNYWRYVNGKPTKW